MSTRTVLVTGSGGSGRTTAAAATAVRAARSGTRTLLIGADDTAGDVLDRPLTTAPTAVEPGLFALRTDAAAEFRAEAEGVQERMSLALDLLGVSPFDGEEITELPGSAEAALLRALRRHAGAGGEAERATGDEGPWGLVVVDCPPTSSLLAVLALPEQVRRYLARVFPAEREAARALRPMLAGLAGVPMPAQWLYSAASRTTGEMAASQAVIEDNATTVRLVVEPGPLAARELRRARTGLALFGHRLEAVLANRLLPEDVTGPWAAARARQQRQELDALRAAGGDGGPAVLEMPHFGRDPVGPDALAEVGGRLDVPPRDAGRSDDPWTVDTGTDGIAGAEFAWLLPLPCAERGELNLVRRGDELILDVGGYRRIIALPSALRRCAVTGAALREGMLRVRFTPDPEVWPNR